MTSKPTPVSGVAAGIPFLAVPPPGGPNAKAPVVVAWHLADPPRTEAAFAAALPLDGLDAWRIYLGLPLSGSRLPPGGDEEIMRLSYQDAVLNIFGPVTDQAAHELGGALGELRDRLGLGDGPIGLLGGSIGAAVALLVIAESDIEISAAVLVSPLVQLTAVVEANERHYDLTYDWSEPSRQVVRRLDFVARAGEIASHGEPAMLLVVGDKDDAPGVREPAQRLQQELGARYTDSSRAELVAIPGMGHPLAEEPGVEPAPQTAHAAQVDAHAVRWLARHLPATDRPGVR